MDGILFWEVFTWCKSAETVIFLSPFRMVHPLYTAWTKIVVKRSRSMRRRWCRQPPRNKVNESSIVPSAVWPCTASNRAFSHWFFSMQWCFQSKENVRFTTTIVQIHQFYDQCNLYSFYGFTIVKRMVLRRLSSKNEHFHLIGNTIALSLITQKCPIPSRKEQNSFSLTSFLATLPAPPPAPPAPGSFYDDFRSCCKHRMYHSKWIAEQNDRFCGPV